MDWDTDSLRPPTLLDKDTLKYPYPDKVGIARKNAEADHFRSYNILKRLAAIPHPGFHVPDSATEVWDVPHPAFDYYRPQYFGRLDPVSEPTLALETNDLLETA